MTKDDIIRMAKEAGLIGKEPNGFDRVNLIRAEARFAQLVAKKAAETEREACAKVVENTSWSNWFQSDCAAAIRARSQL